MKQCMEALTLANAIRTERANYRREVAGIKSTESLNRLAELLHDPPDCLSTVMVIDILQWAHRVSAYRAACILNAVNGRHGWVRVPPQRPVGKLTMQQRLLLVGELQRIAEGGRAEVCRLAA